MFDAKERFSSRGGKSFQSGLGPSSEVQGVWSLKVRMSPSYSGLGLPFDFRMTRRQSWIFLVRVSWRLLDLDHASDEMVDSWSDRQVVAGTGPCPRGLLS